MKRSLRRATLPLIWLGVPALACGSAEPEPGYLTETQLPDRAQFAVVATSMQHRCATLDCHGQAGRNLRLYGLGGLRLSTPEAPIADPLADPTSVAELDASYDSTIGLEPETLWRVIAEGATPNELSIVRKMRGIEKHKGGQLSRAGDALDRCLVSWLTGHSDPAPCELVNSAPRPEFD
jgi:hypothetical protein